MTEPTNDGRANGGRGNGASEATAPTTLEIRQQYVKDLSFENPLSPTPVSRLKGAPDVSVDVTADARPLSEAGDETGGGNAYEVVLVIRVSAKAGEQQVFLAEVIYGGEFVIRNAPQDQIEPLLLIEAPRLMFPFARNVIADMVRHGGFPQMLLPPIDFVELYRQRRARRAAAAKPT